MHPSIDRFPLLKHICILVGFRALVDCEVVSPVLVKPLDASEVVLTHGGKTVHSVVGFLVDEVADRPHDVSRFGGGEFIGYLWHRDRHLFSTRYEKKALSGLWPTECSRVHDSERDLVAGRPEQLDCRLYDPLPVMDNTLKIGRAHV